MLAEDFASKGEGGGALLGCSRFTRGHTKIAGLRVGGESPQLAANFQRTGVEQARDGGVTVFFAYLTFSDGGSAEKQRILSARLQEIRREIVGSLLV